MSKSIQRCAPLIVLSLFVLGGCTVSTALVPVLPEERGEFQVQGEVRQPFYSPHDGLQNVTVRFSQDGGQAAAGLTGPSVEVRYAPEHDPRFPEGAFHEWPEHQEWLPELVGGVRFEQTWCSPYPNLNGIQLRVATFGSDLAPGTGTLKSTDTVEVLTLPEVGRRIASLPGGAEVEVRGAVEGWAQIEMEDGRTGFVELEDFAELPPAARDNDKDVTLELSEIDSQSDEPLRTSVVNADAMHDNSHIDFEFPEIEDATGRCFRFTLSSPESEPGNAVTFRYDPESTYSDGEAIIDGERRDGDLVFQPLYGDQEPLYHGETGDYEWAAPMEAFEARFDPIEGTDDRYLELILRAGDQPVTVPWSVLRPPGQRPLEAERVSDAPQGGLVFNAAFRSDVPVIDAARAFGRDVWSRARQDVSFFSGFAVLLAGTVVLGAAAYRTGSE